MSATAAAPELATTIPGPAGGRTSGRHFAATSELGLWTLQWAIGGFCALVGMMMLVAPHQFGSPAYAAIRPLLPWWGAGFLVTGGAMLVVAAVAPTRPFVVAAHAWAGLALLFLAGGFTATANWFGTTVYGTLGIGTLVAPSVARAPRAGGTGADLFAALLGVAAALTGLVALALPEQFSAPVFDSIRPYLHWYGLGFTAFGALVAWSHLRVGLPWWARWLPSLGLVLTFFGPLLLRAAELRIWTGVLLYAGFGMLLLLLPWAGPALARIDPASLRTRLALTLATTTTLALVLLVTIDTNREEGSLTAQALASQQSLAVALAQDVADYVLLHRSALIALATQPELLAQSPDRQRQSMQAFVAAFPDAAVFALFDADGTPLARSDDRPALSIARAAWFGAVRDGRETILTVVQSPTLERPVFGLVTPIVASDGRVGGVLAASIETGRLADLLTRAMVGFGGRAYVVDQQGRIVAHPDDDRFPALAEVHTREPVARLLSDVDGVGSVAYEGAADRWLVGFARVPGVEWGVVSERPAAEALAGVRIGRERAFGALLAVIAGTAAIGAIAAGWLTAPLGTLASAVRRLPSRTAPVVFEHGGVTEVRRFADAFGEMQARLAERTAEREQSEAALRERDHQLRLALDAGRMGTWDWDMTSGALEWSGRLAEIHGFGPGTFDGRFDSFVAAILPEDRPRVLRAIEQAVAERRDFEIEFRVRWRDGGIRWIAGQGQVFENEQGEPVRMVGIGFDVTDRRRSEEFQRLLAEAGRLLASSLDYETTLQSVARLAVTTLADYCFVDVADEDRITRVEVAHWDPAKAEAARTLLDCPPEPSAAEGIGRVLRTAQPLVVSEVTEQFLRAATRDEQHFERALALGPKSFMCVPLVARGRIVGALSFVSAESGRHYGQQDLELAAALAIRAALAVDNARLFREAQAAIRSRDEFLSIASHELRTPVAGIKGYAQLLLRAQARGRLDDERLVRSLTTIHEASDRLAALTSDLLDVSRIRLGQLPLRLEEVDLVDLVRRVIARYEEQLDDQHRIVIATDRDACPVEADADRLEQVLTNLVENAIKYSPDGGEIRVTLGQVGETQTLTVQDQGIGLPPDAAEAIFKPFGRASNASGRNLPGMGLGLYICRDIVERHGGQIVARSPGEGLGTTLELTLPCKGARTEKEGLTHA